MSPAKHGRHLGITFFFCPASVRPSRPSVTLFRHTFSSHFQITFFPLEGLDWNFIQMFISICVMDTQKGNNPKKIISKLLPLFLLKINLHYANFWLRGDRAFIFHMCIACDNTFPNLVYFLTLWPWPPSLTYFMLTFDPEVIGLSYFTCALPVTTPFWI